MEKQGKGFSRDRDLAEQLYQKYARGGIAISGWKLWAHSFLKKNVWIGVLEGSRALKPILDFVASEFGLVVLSPPFAVTAIARRIDSPGPMFYCQERVGKWGNVFTMFKFRSMVADADKEKDLLPDENESGGVTFKMKRDPRITRAGVIIRNLSIDELPQRYNVFKGDMSLVGP